MKSAVVKSKGKVNGKREQNQRSFISSKWEFHTERKRQDRRVLSECQGSLKHRLYFYFQFYNTKGTVTIHTFQQFFRKVKWAVVQQISVCSTIFEIIDALFCKWPFSHKLHYVKQERGGGGLFQLKLFFCSFLQWFLSGIKWKLFFLLLFFVLFCLNGHIHLVTWLYKFW